MRWRHEEEMDDINLEMSATAVVRRRKNLRIRDGVGVLICDI